MLLLPYFHLQVMGECCIPGRKKVKQAQTSALLHTLLAFGSLQQIHKAHHTINLELQTFVAMVFISLPINQERVLSFLAKPIPYLLTIKTRSKTIHMFFEIVTNDKTKKLQVLRYCIKQYIGKFYQKRSAEYACYIISSWLLQTNFNLCVICHP